VFTGLQAGSNTFRVRAVNSAGAGTEAIVIFGVVWDGLYDPRRSGITVNSFTITLNSIMIERNTHELIVLLALS